MNRTNVDPSEINKFSEIASHWWDEQGQLKSLHDINPLRLNWIKQHAPLAHKELLDVGCGGGILAESLAKQGALVTGIDMSESAIQVANLHQLESQLQINYQVTTVEELAELSPQQFDVITCLEMLEHVPDPESIIKACAKLIKPQGHLFFSTLNRNMKSYVFAILGAEYFLKLLPQNTHDYAKFIRPSELDTWARASHLALKNIIGLTYHPLSKEYKLTDDISVNYLVHYQKT